MKKSGIIKDYLYVLRIIRTASPFRILLTIAMEITGSGFNIFYRVIFIAYFMGCLENNRDFRYVLAVLIGVVILNIIFEIVNSYYHNVYKPKSDLKISIYIKKMLYKKIKTADTACFDNPSYYDDAALVLQDAAGRITGALNTISSFISHAFCAGVFITFFSQVDIIIVAIAMFPLVSNFIFSPIV